MRNTFSPLSSRSSAISLNIFAICWFFIEHPQENSHAETQRTQGKLALALSGRGLGEGIASNSLRTLRLCEKRPVVFILPQKLRRDVEKEVPCPDVPVSGRFFST